MAIGALATASKVLSKEEPPIASSFPVDGRNPEEYLQAATKVRRPDIALTAFFSS